MCSPPNLVPALSRVTLGHNRMRQRHLWRMCACHMRQRHGRERKSRRRGQDAEIRFDRWFSKVPLFLFIIDTHSSISIVGHTYLLASLCVLASPILFAFAPTQIGVLATWKGKKGFDGRRCCASVPRVKHARTLIQATVFILWGRIHYGPRPR